MNCKIALAFASLLAFLTPAAVADEGNFASPLRGIWRSVSFHVDGKPVENPELEYEFLNGERVEVTFPDGTLVKGRYEVQGRDVDFTFECAGFVHVWRGIYETRGETLYLYLPSLVGSPNRPRELKISPGINRLVLIKAG